MSNREPLDIGTVANVIKHGDKLLDLLRGANTMQTVDRLHQLTHATGTHLLTQLLSALDGLEQNLRVLKQAPLTPQQPQGKRAQRIADAFKQALALAGEADDE